MVTVTHNSVNIIYFLEVGASWRKFRCCKVVDSPDGPALDLKEQEAPNLAALLAEYEDGSVVGGFYWHAMTIILNVPSFSTVK